MKKIIMLLVALALPLMMNAATPKGINQKKLSAVIDRYSTAPGFEKVKLGSIGVGMIKSVSKVAIKVSGDEEARAAMKIINGIKRVTIVSYDGCEASVKAEIDGQLAGVLGSADMIMEVKDGGKAMKMFGVYDEDAGTIRDFVLHSEEDSALIMIGGSVSMDMLAAMAAE